MFTILIISIHVILVFFSSLVYTILTFPTILHCNDRFHHYISYPYLLFLSLFCAILSTLHYILTILTSILFFIQLYSFCLQFNQHTIINPHYTHCYHCNTLLFIIYNISTIIFSCSYHESLMQI